MGIVNVSMIGVYTQQKNESMFSYTGIFREDCKFM